MDPLVTGMSWNWTQAIRFRSQARYRLTVRWIEWQRAERVIRDFLPDQQLLHRNTIIWIYLRLFEYINLNKSINNHSNFQVVEHNLKPITNTFSVCVLITRYKGKTVSSQYIILITYSNCQANSLPTTVSNPSINNFQQEKEMGYFEASI